MTVITANCNVHSSWVVMECLRTQIAAFEHRGARFTAFPYGDDTQKSMATLAAVNEIKTFQMYCLFPFLKFPT